MELNTITHGDAFDLIQEIPSKSVQLVICDPPYFIGLTHNGQRGRFVDLSVAKPFFKHMFREINRILKDGTGELYWFTDWRAEAFYMPLMDAMLDGGVRNSIVWDKGSGPGNFYAFQYEKILFACKDNNAQKKGTNIWRSPGFASGAKATNGEKVHPTQKTLEIMEKMVRENSKPGDIVADFFGGSGTTAIVCDKLGRQYYCCELDEENIDIAIKRKSQSFQQPLL